MERRRLNLDEPAQQELPLANPVLVRRRVELDAGPVPFDMRTVSDAQVKDLNAHQDAIRDHAIKRAVDKMVDNVAAKTGLTKAQLMKNADRAFGQPHHGHGGFPGECAATGEGHDFGPHGPNKESMCKFCGEAKPSIVDELCGGYTDWSRTRPPSSGYWELKQHSARAPDGHNWWYSAAINKWHRGVPQKDSRTAGFTDHATLMAAYEWRGVRKPFPGGYGYELERPAFAADFTAAPDTQKVEVIGKLEVAQAACAPLDLNPNTPANRARRRVAL